LNNDFAKLKKKRIRKRERKGKRRKGEREREREREREAERNHLFGALGINSPGTLLREPKKKKKYKNIRN